MISPRIALMSAVAALGVVVGACGLGESGPLERIPESEIPFGLSESTTTTTVASTSTTVAQSTTTGLETTTTTPTDIVELYFVDRGQITPVDLALVGPISPNTVLFALQLGPPDGVAGGALRTAVPPPDVVIAATTDGSGIATVDLPSDFFQRVVGLDQRLAIAQIVLTLVGNVPGVGQVRFTQAGEPVEVQTANGTLSQPGQALARRDFEELLDAIPATTTTTSTSVVAGG